MEEPRDDEREEDIADREGREEDSPEEDRESEGRPL